MTISETLRDAIRNSGESANQLARDTGIPQPTITRFLNGMDSKGSTLDTLAKHFGLELAKAKRKR